MSASTARQEAADVLIRIGMFWASELGNPTGGRQFMDDARYLLTASTAGLRALAEEHRRLVVAWRPDSDHARMAEPYRSRAYEGWYARACELAASAVESVLEAERCAEVSGRD